MSTVRAGQCQCSLPLQAQSSSAASPLMAAWLPAPPVTTVRLWDVTRFKCLHVLRGKRADLLRLLCGLCPVLFPTFGLVSAGHQRSVETVSFSPDSRQLAGTGGSFSGKYRYEKMGPGSEVCASPPCMAVPSPHCPSLLWQGPANSLRPVAPKARPRPQVSGLPFISVAQTLSTVWPQRSPLGWAS